LKLVEVDMIWHPLGVLRNYIWSERATAAVESALLFPILITMLVSMIDIGNALLVNQKLISASQMTADLITRLKNPTLQQRDDAIKAGVLAMNPFPTGAAYKYEIISVEFDETGNPDVVWREASDGLDPSLDLVESTTGLGNDGEGVVAVRVTYEYKPFFTSFVIQDIDMQEIAYMRGRKSPVVGLPL
jgi:Flp pilus assembly protein TadG